MDDREERPTYPSLMQKFQSNYPGVMQKFGGRVAPNCGARVAKHIRGARPRQARGEGVSSSSSSSSALVPEGDAAELARA